MLGHLSYPDPDSASGERLSALKEARKTVERLALMTHEKGMVPEIKNRIEINLPDSYVSQP